jgi:hypothetical protein
MLIIAWQGAAPHTGEYKHNNLPYLTLFYLFYTVLQTRPLDRFARTMAQTTRIDPRKSFWGSH